MEISKLLSDIDMNSKEIAVYLSLVEVGKAPAQLLAKRADVARPTVYSVLRKLIKKGLVSSEEQRAGTFFIANPPEVLLQLIAREKQLLDEKEQRARHVVEMLEPYFSSLNYSVPQFQFFEGEENVEHMLDRFLESWLSSMKRYDNTLWGYQDVSFPQHYLRWLKRYWKARDKEHKICLFSNKEGLEQKLAGTIANREIRELTAPMPLSSSIWISGDFITLIMTRQQPHYAFQIKDSVFAMNLKLVFQSLWQCAKAS